MTAEVLIFLPSIARFRQVYLDQLIESGTLAALALDATPDNMVTEEVKRTLLNHARVDAVVLVEPNKPKRALMNIEPTDRRQSHNGPGVPQEIAAEIFRPSSRTSGRRGLGLAIARDLVRAMAATSPSPRPARGRHHVPVYVAALTPAPSYAGLSGE